MTSPYIDIAGSLNAPSGTITVNSSQGGYNGTLTLESSASISAEGYVQPGTASPAKGLPTQATPLPAVGQPECRHHPLSHQGAQVSVDGSQPVQQTIVGNDETLSFIATARGTRHHQPIRAGDRRPVRGAGQSPKWEGSAPGAPGGDPLVMPIPYPCKQAISRASRTGYSTRLPDSLDGTGPLRFGHGRLRQNAHPECRGDH